MPRQVGQREQVPLSHCHHWLINNMAACMILLSWLWVQNTKTTTYKKYNFTWSYHLLFGNIIDIIFASIPCVSCHNLHLRSHQRVASKDGVENLWERKEQLHIFNRDVCEWNILAMRALTTQSASCVCYVTS